MGYCWSGGNFTIFFKINILFIFNYINLLIFLKGYARIRTLSYPKTDIFILCFAVVNHPSFINVKDRWYVEVSHFIKLFSFFFLLVIKFSICKDQTPLPKCPYVDCWYQIRFKNR